MGKPKEERKRTSKDHSEKWQELKGLSPRDQERVIERALKMARSLFEGAQQRDAHRARDPDEWWGVHTGCRRTEVAKLGLL